MPDSIFKEQLSTSDGHPAAVPSLWQSLLIRMKSDAAVHTGSAIISLALLLLLFGCGDKRANSQAARLPLEPEESETRGRLAILERCNADGRCHARIGYEEALALCGGYAPMLYWNEGRENYLLACECNCTSHDNTGWLVDGSCGKVQGVALGKPTVAAELVDVDAVSDILASQELSQGTGSSARWIGSSSGAESLG